MRRRQRSCRQAALGPLGARDRGGGLATSRLTRGGLCVGIAGAGGEHARAAATLPRREGIARRGQGSQGQGCPWARSLGGRGGGRGGFWNDAFHSCECVGAGAGARLRDAGTGRVSATRLVAGDGGGGAMVKVVDALLTLLRNSRDYNARALRPHIILLSLDCFCLAVRRGVLLAESRSSRQLV
jgi:hypothetical protein